jgi:hypothetical protein
MASRLDEWRVNDIIANKGKKTALQLAQIHSCHYRTVENIWAQSKQPEPPWMELPDNGYSIKIISTTPGKTLNFVGVTQIRKSRDWIEICKGDEVIGLLEPSNITAILPI